MPQEEVTFGRIQTSPTVPAGSHSRLGLQSEPQSGWQQRVLTGTKATNIKRPNAAAAVADAITAPVAAARPRISSTIMPILSPFQQLPMVTDGGAGLPASYTHFYHILLPLSLGQLPEVIQGRGNSTPNRLDFILDFNTAQSGSGPTSQLDLYQSGPHTGF